MSDWQQYKLGSICEVGDGAHAKVKRQNSGILYLTSKNLGPGYLKLNNVDYISEEDYKKLFQESSRAISRLISGDILIGIIGTFGNAYLYKENDRFGISSSVGIIRPDKAILNPRFLYYLVTGEDFKNTHDAYKGGSVQGYTNIPTIKSLPISIPPLPEQKAIASVLSSLDDKIDLLHRQNKTLEAIAAETLFRQWFIEEAQEDWEEVCLEDITQRITDGSHYSPPTTEEGMPMASVKDMYDWGINKDTCRRISYEDYKKLVDADCRPLKNDILIAKDGSYLKHVFVVEQDLDIVILSSIAILRPNFKMHPILLALFLKQPSTLDQLENIVTGAVIPRIVLKDFRKFQLLLPPKNIQERAVSSIFPLYRKCWGNNKQIRTLERLRDTLLPKLMSGEVRVAS
jgi:type I restriction enzyme S subunit